MTEVRAGRFAGRDGVALAYRELGTGRPLVLLHGVFGDGGMWLRPGPARDVAALGHRVILPDLRAHGDSAGPRDPARYPPDVLATDGLALLENLGLADGGYDLGGYSLGARVALRMLIRGARPARAILGGQGRDAMLGGRARGARYRALAALIDGTPLEPGSAEAEMAHWITRSGGDPVALRHLLDSLVPSTVAELRGITTRTLVLLGAQDTAQSTADALAAELPDARLLRVPGDHVGALSAPGLAGELAAFLR